MRNEEQPADQPQDVEFVGEIEALRKTMHFPLGPFSLPRSSKLSAADCGLLFDPTRRCWVRVAELASTAPLIVARAPFWL
jgi:hypothetical protein